MVFVSIYSNRYQYKSRGGWWTAPLDLCLQFVKSINWIQLNPRLFLPAASTGVLCNVASRVYYMSDISKQFLQRGLRHSQVLYSNFHTFLRSKCLMIQRSNALSSHPSTSGLLYRSPPTPPAPGPDPISPPTLAGQENEYWRSAARKTRWPPKSLIWPTTRPRTACTCSRTPPV